LSPPECWLQVALVPALGPSSFPWERRKPGSEEPKNLGRVEFQEWQVRTGFCMGLVALGLAEGFL
jgi:hypothetical protein